MTELNVEVLREQVKGLLDSEAAEILDTVLRQAAAGDDYYVGNNSHTVIPVLVMLGHKDLVRADAVIDFLYRKHDRPYVAWIRESLHKDVRAAQRRRALEAMTREERDAQLVLASLMPGGKPQDDAEQTALVMARLKDDPAHACALAAQWWNGSYLFEEPVNELMEACWWKYPDDFRAVIMCWQGSGREGMIKSWVERLLPTYNSWSVNQLIRLLEVMQGGHYVDRELLLKVLNTLENWSEEDRRTALVALIPLWVRVFPNLYKSTGVDAVEVFLKLWKYDNSAESRARLDNLLASRETQHRLPDARRIKRTLKSKGEIGQQFGATLHAAAILARRGKKLSDYLNRKYIRPDHRRLWRSFLRSERIIQQIADDVLRARLLSEHAVIARETRRARKGAILVALETETEEPIRVVPEKSKNRRC